MSATTSSNYYLGPLDQRPSTWGLGEYVVSTILGWCPSTAGSSYATKMMLLSHGNVILLKEKGGIRESIPRQVDKKFGGPRRERSRALKDEMVLVAESCPTLCNPMECSPAGFSVHGILQARMLEWVAISISRGSSKPGDWTRVSCIAGKFFTIWAPRKPQGGNRGLEFSRKRKRQTSFFFPLYSLVLAT